MFAKNVVLLAVSVLLHGSIVGVVLAFSSGAPATEEQVYRVTLAEFSAPATPAAAVSTPPQLQLEKLESPKPEPVVEPPRPVAKKTPKPKGKTISTKKTAEKKKPAEESLPATSPPPAQVQTASTGPAGPTVNSGAPTMSIGGLAAYDVDAVDQRPSIAKRVVPEYPQKARRMNVQGKVFVKLVVDMAGHPKECKIHQADPAGYFEDAALTAARKTRFIPGKVKGQPVNTVVLVPFVFALR